jgi:hypothetical protein
MTGRELFGPLASALMIHIKDYHASCMQEQIGVYGHSPAIFPDEAEQFLEYFNKGKLHEELSRYKDPLRIGRPFKRPDIMEAVEDFFQKGKHLKFVKG